MAGGCVVIVVWIVVALVVFLLVAFGISYNRFVHQRNMVQNSWHNIDTELQRRYDLIPNLVETVRGYATHERQVLEQVTAARANAIAAKGTPDTQEGPERALVDNLRSLFAVAERYPALKASGQYLSLQHELVDTEDRLQVARRIYNANVRALNTRLQAFPSVVVGRLFGFRSAAYFEVDPSVRAVVRVV